MRGAILDFFIEGSTAITVSGGRAIGLFDYPGGGHVKKVIKEPGDQSYSVVVSAAALLKKSENICTKLQQLSESMRFRRIILKLVPCHPELVEG